MPHKDIFKKHAVGLTYPVVPQVQLLHPRLAADERAGQQPQHAAVDAEAVQVEGGDGDVPVVQPREVAGNERLDSLELDPLLAAGAEGVGDVEAVLDERDGDVPHGLDAGRLLR